MKRIGLHSAVMLVSVISGLGCGLVSRNPSIGLYAGAVSLMFIPTVSEPPVPAIMCSMVAASLLMVLSWLGLNAIAVVAGSLLTLLFLLNVTYIRYREPAIVFKYDAAVTSMDLHVRMIYALMLQFYGMLLILWDGLSPVRLLVSLCLLSLYAALMARLHTGRVMLIAKDAERLIRGFVSGSLMKPETSAKSEEDRIMLDDLAGKIVEHFERDLPYLDVNYSLMDMSMAVGSNRNYVSRTIHAKFGCNFSQLVNKFRIEYAIKLLETKPNLKKSEIAERSGFGSVVTFNMAFKMFKGTTPGAYLDEYLSKKKVGLL